MSGFRGKKILFGVTGSIAAFKTAGWVHSLTKEDALVTVVMTRAATRFVTDLTFSALSGNQVYTEMFASDPKQAMAHITLSADADIILIAPATAHTIARFAHGLADDLLSASVLAAPGKQVVICPAMNSNMYANRATQDNLNRLREFGYVIVEPDSGKLACGDEGPGRLPEWERVREILLYCVSRHDLEQQHVLITAGPTREDIDPARFLSNRSSGRMGYALAQTARRRGAEVTLVSGPVALAPPAGVEVVQVLSARDMFDTVMRLGEDASIIVKAAAVADFRPAHYDVQKIKKAGVPNHIELVLNRDILAELGKMKTGGQFLVGFAAESENHLEEGTRKLKEKNLDLIVINDIAGEDTGFDVDTNQVTLLDKNGSTSVPLLSKEETADRIWDKIVSSLQKD